MQKFYNLFRLNPSLLWKLKFNLLFTFFFISVLLASGLQAGPLSFPDDGIEKMFAANELQDSLSLKWIQRNGTTNTSWFSVAWGGPKGEEVFVAVGGDELKTSSDGITWTPRLPANNNTWISVTWGGPVGKEVFVAVASSGTGSRVMTSPDGITWTPRSAAIDLGWISVTWGGPVGQELFVAVAVSGTGERVMTSSDGITWISRAAVDDVSWRSVTWGGTAGKGLFVAVGANGKIMTSPDGITWTSQTTSFTGFMNSVTWGGLSGQELFVAVGVGGVYTSPDGINWNWTLPQPNDSFSAVTWGGPQDKGLFVATSSFASSNRVITSPDGINWTIQFNDTSINKDWRSVTWGGPVGQELFVAVASKILGAVDNNDQQVMTAARSTLTVLINSVEVLANSSVKVRSIIGDWEVIERGLIYSDTIISNNPVLETNGIVTIVDGSTAAANFDLILSNLSPNKIYVVKAYIKTTNGKVFYSAADYFSTNTAPAFDHSLSDGVLKIDIPENSTAVLDILATDPDQGQTLAFTLEGTDAAFFELNQATRKLSFKSAPDFEDPKDQNKDNVYELAVIATDNAPLPKSNTLTIQVTVTDVAEIPALENQAISDIGATGAKLSATIVHNGGGGTITASGFVLSATSANSDPQLGGTGVSAVSAGASQVDFSNLVSGLQAETSYSYRAYATNGAGTAYSEVATFTTLTTAVAPPVFGYAPALLQEIDQAISAIQPEILGSEVPEGQTYAAVSTFSTNVSGPRGMVMDAFGNLYVAERGGKRISKFTPDGTKTVIYQFGSFEPVDITIDSSTGDLYFTIAAHRIIWFPNGNKANYPAQQPTYAWTNETTNVFAGSSTSGTTNATGTSARFNAPAGIAMSPDNTYLLVAENGSHRIRRIDVSNRAVTTYAGATSAGTADGDRSTTARFNNPEGVHFAADGSVYVTEWSSSNHRIRKISEDQVSTLAGSSLGFLDGIGTDAKFERPRGITSDALGNIFVVEGNNNVVRRINPSGEVGVLAGSLLGGYDNTKGTTDGVAFAARFDAPQGVYFAPDGFLYVSDIVGNRIRKISLSGWELLTPLPAGLSFDSNTAEISGTPTTFTFEPHYFSAFDSNTLEKDSKGATPELTGAAQVRSGFLQLTPLSNTQTGGLHISGKGIKEGSLRVDFRLLTTKTSSAGNGLSYSFAKDINSTTSGTPEVGIGSGISLAFNTTLGGVRLYYGASKANSSTVGTGGLLAFNADNTWRGKSAQVSLEVSLEGKVKVWIDGTLIFNDVQLPEAYLQEDFTSWNHVFRAGTGTSNDLHAIDNLSIAQGYGKGSYRVRASNVLGTHTSSLEMSVVTLPVVTTLGVSDITFNSAKVSFRTLFNGANQLQKQGVIWGTSPDVTVDNALGKTEEMVIIDTLTSILPNLAGGTTYYVKAYAENAFGVGYGNELLVETPIAPPLFAYASDRIILKNDQSAELFVTSSGGAVPDGYPNVVSTIAGSSQGSLDGQGTAAQFNIPTGITVDATGSIYVADSRNHRIRKITPDGMVSTLAGSSSGSLDGQGTAAQFNIPTGITVDATGNLFVTDFGSHRIRKITPDGMVSTLAGSSSGSLDGQGTAAQFNLPTGITVDATGNLFVTDRGSNRIRKITPDGMVSTLAGSSQGSLDGQGTDAQFNSPRDITVGADGNLYVAALNNNNIRKITPDGMVSTFAGSSQGSLDGEGTASRFNLPTGITVDATGNLYVTDFGSHRIRKITPGGMVSTLAGSSSGSLDGQGTAAQFNSPNGIALDAAGNLYVADGNNQIIRKITTTGWSISPALPIGLEFNLDGSITGTPTATSPTQTYTVTGANVSGSYSYSFELGVQEVGLSNLTVSSGSLNVPFKPEQTDYSVSVDATVSSISFTATELFAGSTIQWKLGSGSFTSIASGAASPEISLEEGRNTITIEVSEGGNFKTYTLLVTKPVTPPAIAYVQNLTLPLGEAMSPQLPQNSGGMVPNSYASIVSTIAGSSNGFADGQGTAARFIEPVGLAIDQLGNLYVADRGNHRIRKITTDGQVSTIAGSSSGFIDGQGSSARFSTPNDVAVDAFGNLYVADRGNHRIRKITPDGLVSTLAGSTKGFSDGQGTTAQFDEPTGIVVDMAGNLYVADRFNHRIRKISPDGMVTTLAGSTLGFSDGQGETASFNEPLFIDLDASGNVYVTDPGNQRIRKITPDGKVSTLVNTGLGGSLSFYLNFNQGVAIDALGNLYVSDLELTLLNRSSLIRKISLNGWSVSPSLPAGLVLNEDGSISGTPWVLSPAKDYVVTGRNAGGESSYTIRIEVTAGATEGLRNLEISQGNLSPAFSNTTLAYEVQLASTAETFTFTPTAVNTNAAISLNGVALSNATATQAYPLNFGPNTFTFVVKETDNTEKTYTVVVTRALGSQQDEILWAGSSSKQWTTGSNWTGNTAPDFGEDIKFSPTAANDLKVDADLTAGTIDFNGSDKKVVLVNNDLSVSGFANRTAPNYVEITGSGRLKASIGSNLKFLFPVGMDTYSPVSITNKTGAAAVFSVGLSGEVLDGGTTGNVIPNARIKRTWDISNASSSVSGSGIDLEFTWTAAEDSGVKNPALYHYENDGWVKLDDAKTTVDIANRVLIYKGYTGSLSSFAIYDELPTETQLTITAPDLVKSKLYDGTNSAQVTAGILSSVADADVVTVTATAEYDNANAGTGKTIRVVYTLDGADASKYLKPVDEEYTDGEITKIQLMATAPTLTTSKVYDGTVKATVEAGTLQGVLTDEKVNLFASAAYESATAGSSKKITVSYRIDGSDAVNYLAPADEEVSTSEITQAALTVNVKDDAKFVAQSDPVGFDGADITGFVNGETVSDLAGSLTISRSNAATNTAGDYAGVLVGSGYTSDNYLITYVDGDFSILPADVLLVKLETATTTYGNDPEYTVLSAGYFSEAEDQLVDLTDQTFVSGNSVQAFDGFEPIRFDLDLSNPLWSTSGNLQAGSYEVTFANEELSSNVNSLKVIGQVEVAPLAIQATVSTGEFKEYDGTPAMIDVTVDALGLITGDEVTVSTATGLFEGSNAGNQEYTVSGLTLSGDDAGNYTLDAELKGQGQITAKALTVTGTTVTKEKAYDGTATAQVSRGTVSGVINTDKVSLSVSASYADKFAGTNKPITVSYSLEGIAAGNYLAPQSESILDGEITRKDLTITDPSVVLRKAYDGTRASSVEAGNLLGLISGDNVTVTASAQYDDASVGTGKTITVSYSLAGSDTLNYQTTLQEFVTDQGEIYATGPIQLLITEPSLTLIKGYDGTTAVEQPVPGTLIGLADGADVHVEATAVYENSEAGKSKKITVTYTLSGTDAEDYLAPPAYTVFTGEITPVQLSVTGTAVDKTKIYDGGTLAEVTAAGTLSGIVNGDEGKVTLKAAATFEDKNVGSSKKIRVAFELEGEQAGNYLAPIELDIDGGEITKAPLTIRADDKLIDCGAGIPIFTWTYVGLLGDDRSIETEPSISSQAVPGSVPGSYAITLSGGESQNYAFTLESGSLLIRELAEEVIEVTACETYTWEKDGKTYTESGSYEVNEGCGKITLQLTILKPEIVTVESCDSYEWKGETYTQSGSYDYIPDGESCATERLILTIKTSGSNTTTETACDSYTWSVNGETYTESGTYTVVNGCVTETLELTITASTSNTTTETACDSYIWTVDGKTYMESGTYTFVDGCHTETIELTITESTSNTTKETACDSYTWSVDGETYTESGTYTFVDGCHTETLELTITVSTSNMTTETACDSFTWTVDGKTYIESGTYTFVDGCHTETLELTITASTSNTTTETACDSYTWSVNGETYRESGTYTFVDGCHTETLELTITASTSNTTTETSCDSYTWSVNGETYTESGSYTLVDGCHTETLELTITESTSNTTTETACDSYIWTVDGKTYMESGTYTFVDGCHTETLELTILEEVFIILSKENDGPVKVGNTYSVAMEVKNSCGEIQHNLAEEDLYFDFGADTTAEIRNFRFEDDQYKFDVYSERSGLLTVKVGIEEVVESDLDLEFVSTGIINIENSILNAKDQAKLVADGKVALPVTIQALDEFGNVVPGVTITLVQPANGRTIIRVNQVSTTSRMDMLTAHSSVSGVTDDEGNVGFTISSSVAQKVRFTVYAEIDGEQVELGSFELEFLADKIDVASSTVEAEPSTQVVGESSTLKVSLRDENGNPNIGLLEEDFEIDLGGAKAKLVADSFGELLVENEDGVEVPSGVYTWEILGSEPEKITVGVKVKQIEYGDDVDNGDDDIEENENEFDAADIEDEWLDLGAVAIEFILPCLLEEIEYTGMYFAGTSSSSSSTASVLLSAGLKVKEGGDVEKVRVRFVDLERGKQESGYALSGWLTARPVLGLPGVGTVAEQVNLSIGNLDSRQFVIGIEVENCKLDEDESHVIVTVSRPLNDFVTGGGYILSQNSKGKYQGKEGSRTNFGFNVKYNRKRTNLQGMMNVIWRVEQSGEVRVYQFKGNSYSNLSVRLASGSSSAEASFMVRGNLQDVTDPDNKITVESQKSMQVSLTDRGQPTAKGISGDDISFTLWETDGTLLWSSSWDGLKTDRKRLESGNILINQPPATGQIVNQLQIESHPSGSQTQLGELINWKVRILEDNQAVPSGTITLFAGGLAIGRASVSGNEVVFGINSLSIGNHEVSAYYSGDSRFRPSESTLINHTVIESEVQPENPEQPESPKEEDGTTPVKEEPKSKPSKGRNGREEESPMLKNEPERILEKEVLNNQPVFEEQLIVDVFPNPSNGFFKLKLMGFESGELEVLVLSLSGTKVLQKNVDYKNNSGEMIDVDISDYASAGYLCYVMQGNKAVMVRLIKK